MKQLQNLGKQNPAWVKSYMALLEESLNDVVGGQCKSYFIYDTHTNYMLYLYEGMQTFNSGIWSFEILERDKRYMKMDRSEEDILCDAKLIHKCRCDIVVNYAEPSAESFLCLMRGLAINELTGGLIKENGAISFLQKIFCIEDSELLNREIK